MQNVPIINTKIIKYNNFNNKNINKTLYNSDYI
jgi:hypothetical protein